MVKGIIINKFRGDKRLLKPAIDFLERRTGIKVLAVIPYFKHIKIPEEDSIPFDNQKHRTMDVKREKINIAVIQLPHISNFTDFDALESEPDVNLYYAGTKEQLKNPDLIILPGTKNTIEDLLWLKKTKISDRILWIMDYEPRTNLIGICGGYQMLGKNISDPKGVESAQKQIKGLGLLPIETLLKPRKILSQTHAIHLTTNIKLTGYQIHHGRTVNPANINPVFKIANNNRLDGAVCPNGRIWGTYLHGIFDNPVFRRHILNDLRQRKGLKPYINKNNFNLEAEFDKLAEIVRKNTDMESLYKIIAL